MEISILLLAILSGGGFIGCQVVKIIKSVMADIADVTTGALLLQPQGTRRGRLMRRPCLILALYAVLAGSLPCRAEDPAADRVTITLPEALTAALKNNLDLANAVLETSKSEKGSKIVDRERLPELSLDGRYTRLDTPEASEIPVPGYSFPESEADLALVATMPLWTGGRLSSASRQASTGADLAKEAERTTRFDLLLETVTAFYELLAAQKLVEISREALESSRRHLADVGSLLAQGQVAKADLYRTELNVAERESDAAGADANLVRRSEHLSFLIFPDRIVDLRASWKPAEPGEPPPVREWMALALDHSPELASARLSLELAGEEVTGARAERYPNFGLFGAYGARDDHLSYRDDDRYWNAGLALSMPLFKGGRIGLEIDQSREGAEQAANASVTTRRRVRRGLVDAHVGTVLALRQFAAAEKAVRSAGENDRVTRLKYREGLVPNIDVIDALLSLSRAQFDRIEALKNYYTNRTRLMRLAGTIEEVL
jgi:outer membrane protein TolC